MVGFGIDIAKIFGSFFNQDCPHIRSLFWLSLQSYLVPIIKITGIISGPSLVCPEQNVALWCCTFLYQHIDVFYRVNTAIKEFARWFLFGIIPRWVVSKMNQRARVWVDTRVKPNTFCFYAYSRYVCFLGSVHDTGSLVSIPSIQTESTYQSAYGRPPSVNSFGSPSINGTFEQPSHDRRYNDGRKRFCLHFCMQ